MRNDLGARVGRRSFLSLAVLAGVMAVFGCGGEIQVETVTTPPAKRGNRERLDKLKGEREQTKPSSRKK